MERFAFRQMRVYRLALELASQVHAFRRALERADWIAGNQLMSAVLSIMLNIAEGAGEYRGREKARFYRLARRSCYESVAALDHLVSVGTLTRDTACAWENSLGSIAAGLTALIHTMEQRA